MVDEFGHHFLFEINTVVKGEEEVKSEVVADEYFAVVGGKICTGWVVCCGV